MSVTAAVEVANVGALAVELDPRIDIAAVGLTARDRPRVFLELGAAERQGRVVAWRGVERDPAGVVTEEISPKEAAADALKPRDPILDLKRRFELGDLLTQQADAVELHHPLNLERTAVGPTADVVELSLNVL